LLDGQFLREERASPRSIVPARGSDQYACHGTETTADKIDKRCSGRTMRKSLPATSVKHAHPAPLLMRRSIARVARASAPLASRDGWEGCPEWPWLDLVPGRLSKFRSNRGDFCADEDELVCSGFERIVATTSDVR
jgi:hypothetical protein